jgi:hypothetical protein
MAPEIFEAQENGGISYQGQAANIFALGVILFWLYSSS